MVSVVVIDDGIWTDETEVMSKVTARYEADDSGKVCLCETEVRSEDTHGGICAYIIQDVCPEVRFVSLRILNHRGKCCGKKLRAALEWCTKHDCDIVHMSLATRSYHDYSLIKDIVPELLEQNKLLVSAVDNAGVVSYPAFFQGVFAVFMDHKDRFAEGTSGLFYAENMRFFTVGVQYRKRKRNAAGEWIKLDFANSYAAAALTGYLAKFMASGSHKKASDLRKAFFREIYRNGGCVKGVFPRLYATGRARTVPAIGIIQEDAALLKEVTDFYKENGYRVAAFTECHTEDDIPLRFYFDEQMVIDEVFLLNMEEIYHPDLILFQAASDDIVTSKEVEMLIKTKGHQIEVWTEERKRRFADKEEAFYASMDILMGIER